MTMLRMEATLVHLGLGNQDFDVDIKSEVPPEAGPWFDMPAVMFVFEDIIDGWSKSDDWLVWARLAFFVNDVKLFEATSDPDGVAPDTMWQHPLGEEIPGRL